MVSLLKNSVKNKEKEKTNMYGGLWRLGEKIEKIEQNLEITWVSIKISAVGVGTRVLRSIRISHQATLCENL